MVIMWALVDNAGVHYLLSLPIAYTTAISSNYVWNSRWTFNKFPGWKGYLKFLSSSWMALGINECILAVITAIFDFHYLIGTAAGMTAGFLFNYLVSRKFVWA